MTIYKPGDSILTLKPIAHAVHGLCQKNVCDACCLRQEKLLQCAQCHTMHYCNRNCQRAAWPLHKLECLGIQRSHQVPTATIRLLLKLLQLWKRKGDDLTDVAGYRKFGQLQSHASEFRGSLTFVQEFTGALATLKHFLSNCQPGLEPPSDDVIFLIYCKLQINAYQITDSEFNSVAIGLYVSGAVFNHSCWPNAVNIFHGTQLHVVAMMEVQGGLDQVHLSYVDHIARREDRQQELLTRYCFHCECAGCHDAEWESLLTTLKCPNKTCGVSLPPEIVACPACGSEEPASTEWRKMQAQLAATLKKKLDALQMLMLRHDVNSIREVEETFSSLLDCNRAPWQCHLVVPNCLYFRVLDMKFEFLLERSRWADALELSLPEGPLGRCYAALFGHKQRRHPLHGLFLLKVTKLADLEAKDEAAQMLWNLTMNIMNLYLPYWPASTKEQVEALHQQLVLPA